MSGLRGGSELHLPESQDAGLLRVSPADGYAGGEEGITTERLPLQRAVIAGGIRCRFFDAVAGIRVEPVEGDAGVLVGVDALGGVGQQQCIMPVDIEKGTIRPGVGGDKAVQVAQLDDGSQLFCQFHAGADVAYLLIAEGAGVELQSEPPGKRHIKAEFEGGFAVGVAVGAGGEVAADGVGRKEVGGRPLHAEAVAGIGVIAQPEFLMEGGRADIQPSAAGAAALEGDIRELLPQLPHLLVVAGDVVEIEIALQGGGQMRGTGVGNLAVAVPFHVGDTGCLPQRAAHRLGELQRGGADIQHQLVAFLPWEDAGQRERQLRAAGVQVTLWADHFRFHPDTEINAAGGSMLCQALQALRQFGGVGLPVTQRGGVIIPLPEPAVIQHKEFCTESGGALHHLPHGRLMHIEMHALPAVEQSAAALCTVRQNPAAQVAVHIPAGGAAARAAECQHGGGQGDASARAEGVGAVLKIVSHAQEQVSVAAVFEAQFVIAAPGQRTHQAVAVVFIRRGICCQQEAGRALLRRLDPGRAADGKSVAAADAFLAQVILSGPSAAKSGEVVLPGAQRQRCAVCPNQQHVARPSVFQNRAQREDILLCHGADGGGHAQFRVARVAQSGAESCFIRLHGFHPQITAQGAVRPPQLQGILPGIIAPEPAGVEICGNQRPLCRRSGKGIIRVVQPHSQSGEEELALLIDPQGELQIPGKKMVGGHGKECYSASLAKPGRQVKKLAAETCFCFGG